MRHLTLLALPLLLLACKSGGSDMVHPYEMSEFQRVEIAGDTQIRAAYSGYALTLFDLQLSFLETLPRGWFPNTTELEEAADQFARVTDHEAPSGAMLSSAGVARNARIWLNWYVNNRERRHEAFQEQWDPMFLRLKGTTPFLDSPEFQAMVRSVGELSGLPPNWGRSEHYQRWEDFAADRQAWRVWFNNSVERLEYDNATGQLVIGRGLSAPSPSDHGHTH